MKVRALINASNDNMVPVYIEVWYWDGKEANYFISIVRETFLFFRILVQKSLVYGRSYKCITRQCDSHNVGEQHI